MTGDELFDRMKNKEIGVILESHEDAEQLAVLLQGILHADELVNGTTTVTLALLLIVMMVANACCLRVPHQGQSFLIIVGSAFRCLR